MPEMRRRLYMIAASMRHASSWRHFDDAGMKRKRQEALERDGMVRAFSGFGFRSISPIFPVDESTSDAIAESMPQDAGR